MPITSSNKRAFKPSKTLVSTWDSFRKGLNTLLRDSELSPEQAKQMQNLILEGKGVVTQRPGTQNLHQASTNGKVRGIFGSKVNGVNELLAVSDDGWLTKKNSATFTRIDGASWASGYKVRMAQLRDKIYLVQSQRPMTRYDGTTLLSYTTLLSPVSLYATNISGVTGTFTYSWRVAGVTDIGRTLASDPVVLANLPENLDRTIVRISWTPPSGASGLVKSWEIYGREQGSQTRMTGVSPSSSTWEDDGSVVPSLISGLPDFNETAGPNAKYITKSVGKIIVANIGSKKSRIMWSGADINAGKFSWTVGGGYTDLDENDGTEITGMVEVEENKVVVWKERSIFQVKLTFNASLGVVEPLVTKITNEVGCMSADTIMPAINNHFFIGLRPGRGISLNTLGYEQNIAAPILRTTEVTKVIAPDLEAVNLARLDDMFAVVYAGVYWWFFPVGSTSMRCYGYDLERLSLNGPHTFPDNPVVGTVWYDDNGMPRFVYGDGDDGYVTEVSKSYGNDKGTDFQWSFTSKKEDFKLPFKLKTLLKAFIHLSDVQGGLVSTQIQIEKADGNISSASSFSLDSPNQYAGFGSFKFGTKKFGHTDQASLSSTNTSEIRKYIDLNESNIVSSQFIITGTGVRAKIIETQLEARVQPGAPSDWLATS
jgi:hypothetical protein